MFYPRDQKRTKMSEPRGRMKEPSDQTVDSRKPRFFNVRKSSLLQDALSRLSPLRPGNRKSTERSVDLSATLVATDEPKESTAPLNDKYFHQRHERRSKDWSFSESGDSILSRSSRSDDSSESSMTKQFPKQGFLDTLYFRRKKPKYPEMISVYLNFEKLGLIHWKKAKSSLEDIRCIIKSSFQKPTECAFYFWQNSESTIAINPEDEYMIHASYCLHDDSISIGTKEIMKDDFSFDALHLSEEELRDLSSEAQSTIRTCIRILEIPILHSDSSYEAVLPRLAKCCTRFIKFVARAAVEIRLSNSISTNSEVNWCAVELCLHRIEEQIHLFNSRQRLAEWWYYRKDQKRLKDIFISIQNKFRRLKDLRADHPVFTFKFPRLGVEESTLVDVLDKTSLFHFTGNNFKDYRTKLARILGVTEDKLRSDILSKKENVFVDRVDDTSLFRESIVKTSGEASREKRNALSLKSLLAPLFDLQNELLDSNVREFCPGTRSWAFDAFDEWIRDHRKINRSFILTAPSGSGKSMFASKLIRNRSDHILAYHFCRHDDFRFRDAKIMLLSLIYQLTLQSPYLDNRIRKELSEKSITRKDLLGSKFTLQKIFSEFLATPLSEISVPASHRFVIVIDGIDEAKDGIKGSNEIVDIIHGMFHRLPGWVLFCFTTGLKLPVLKKLRKFNALMISAKGSENECDFQLYFKKVDWSKHVLHARMNQDELPNILAYNAGESFFFCKLILTKIQECEKDSQLEELCMLKLDNLFKRDCIIVCEEDANIFWGAVKLCMVAFKPLHFDVMSDLLGCKKDLLLDILQKAQSFFALKSNAHITFDHKLAQDWLFKILPTSTRETTRNETYGFTSTSNANMQDCDGQSRFRNCHAFFATQVHRLTCAQKGLCSDVSDFTRSYLLQHGVQHLALGEFIREATQLILNPAWLLMNASDLDSITRSCELLSDGDRVLALLSRALSLSGDAIQHDHRQLIGQLIGRLLAVTEDGHGDNTVRDNMVKFLNNLRTFDYGFQWWCPVGPTWDQAEQKHLRTMIGHKDSIQCVAWHTDGRKCASASWDCDIKIWDTRTGDCSFTLSGHCHSVWAIDWDPTGSFIASGSLDKSIRIWNVAERSCEAILEGHTDSVLDVRWSNDAVLLASASRDRTIKIWNVSSRTCINTLYGSVGFIYSLCWEGGNGTRICSGSTDNLVYVWDSKLGTCISKLVGHRDWVRSVYWCKTGRHIISASADQTVRVWDAETLECEHVLMGHSDTVWSVSKSPDGRYAVSGSSDGTVRVWDCTTGREEQVLEGHKGAAWSVAFCPDSKLVVSGSSDKSLIVWDTSVEAQREINPGHLQPIWCVDVSRDGSKIISGSADKTSRLWNASSGLCEKTFSGHTGPIFSIKFSTDGKLMATASSDNTAAVYRINSGERILQLIGHRSAVWCVTWSTDDSLVFTGSKDMTIRAWDSSKGKCIAVMSGHTNDVKGLAIRRDGKQLASASSDASIRVWDLSNFKCLFVLTRQGAGCLCVDWHPNDSNLLVAGYVSGSVSVWKTSTCEREIDFLPGHERRTNSVSWSPDGKRVVSVSSDKEIRIWRMDDQRCETKILASTVGIFGVVWSDRYLVCCGADKSIRLFNPSNWRCESVLAGENRNSLGILDVALSKDGKYAVSGSRQRIVQIWSANGACIKTFSGHTNWVSSVFFDESGKTVLSRSDDGTSRLWDIESGKCLLVSEDEDVIPQGFVAVPKAPIRSLSRYADTGHPVGVLCDKVRVENDRACGWIGKQVCFFQLMGNP
jgi:WD40 repeat protein